MIAMNTIVETGNDLLDAALDYARLGYPVFPCAPNGKIPVIPASEGGRGCHDGTTDETQIRAWWAKYPNANIGLLMDGLVAIDIDGASNTWPNNPDYALDLIGAPTAKTPKGGRHHVFRAPAGKNYGNTVGKLADGVDTRVAGGYICVWPSVLPNGQYKWLEDLELNIPPAQLPVLPAWLERMLDNLKHPSKGYQTDSPGGNAIREGSRNDSLARHAGAMRRYGFEEPEIQAALLRMNLDRLKPPLPEKEVLEVARKISRYTPNQLSTSWATCLDQINDGTFDQSAFKGPAWRIRKLSDVKPSPPKWIVFGPDGLGFLPAGLSMLVGDGGIGKSTLVREICASITTGEGAFQCDQGQVIWMAWEDDEASIFLPHILACKGDPSNINLVDGEVDANGHPIPWSPSRLELARKELANYPNLRLMVVDCLASSMGDLDSNDSKSVRPFLTPLNKLGQELGIAILVLHHPNKRMEGSPTARVAGSNQIINTARHNYFVGKDPDDESVRHVSILKTNLPAYTQGFCYRDMPADANEMKAWATTKGISFPDDMPLDCYRRIQVLDDKPPLPVAELATTSRGSSETRINLAKEIGTWIKEQLKEGKPILAKELKDRAAKAHPEWNLAPVNWSKAVKESGALRDGTGKAIAYRL